MAKKPKGWNAFNKLAKRIVAVPKSKVDEAIAEAAAAAWAAAAAAGLAWVAEAAEAERRLQIEDIRTVVAAHTKGDE